MESLAGETWDVVIAGTSLSQALLALSLSRSDLKILHVDEHLHYGGSDAGLSLDEAESWVEQHELRSSSFSAARLIQTRVAGSKLASSRSYTLSLNPQIIYAQSKFLPSLVSSAVNAQLEFLAVGSWWIYKDGRLQKVPSTREDVFADESLTRRDKIGLMKFLRYVLQDNTENSEVQGDLLEGSLHEALGSNFKISPALQLPVSALALSRQAVKDTEVAWAIPRIQRHMRSMGHFGPGFCAVLAKYASNAEIAQVCCRACAVGGATYLLGQGVSDIAVTDGSDTIGVTLTNGLTVRAKHVAGSIDDLPRQVMDVIKPKHSPTTHVSRLIAIVSSALRRLFPPTSDNGPTPAAAIVVLIDTEDNDKALERPAVYLQIHSEETGECPSGQCVIYASTLHTMSKEASVTQERLESAVQRFLESSGDASAQEETTTPAEILWSVSYLSQNEVNISSSANTYLQDDAGHILVLPSRDQGIALDDAILADVKAVWQKVLGEKAKGTEFLRFEDRSAPQGSGDEE